jgi:regulator of protease activity HflC (stomatin/prohibitin superfamily)
MSLWKTIHIPVHQRAVALKHGVPIRALEPGKQRLWGGGVAVKTFDVDEVLLAAPAELRALLPETWFHEVSIGTRQRGVIWRDGRPVRFLRPGVHRYWTVDRAVELRVLSIDDAPPEMTDELRAVIPAHELVEVTVRQHERGLAYVQGRFERLLEPGRHVFWSTPEARVTILSVDVRLQQVTLQGQELMTRDKVTLRLTLTAEYAPADPPTLTHAVADIQAALYLAVQLAARDYVAGVTLDELLEGRDAMSRFLADQVVPRARGFGVEVTRVGVKDVVLPGEMKTLLNRVIEAEKEAAANVILRREEAAATRNMANTARVVADNPMLMRLKELETLEKVAAQIDEVRLVIGDGGLKALLPGTFGDAGSRRAE